MTQVKTAVEQLNNTLNNYKLTEVFLKTYAETTQILNPLELLQLVQECENFKKFMFDRGKDVAAVDQVLSTAPAFLATLPELSMHEFVEQGASLTNKEITELKEELEELLETKKGSFTVVARIGGIGMHLSTVLMAILTEEDIEFEKTFNTSLEAKIARMKLSAAPQICLKYVKNYYDPYEKASVLAKKLEELGITYKTDSTYETTEKGQKYLDGYKKEHAAATLISGVDLNPPLIEELEKTKSTLSKKIVVTQPIESLILSKLNLKRS